VVEQKNVTGVETDRHGIRLDAYIEEKSDTGDKVLNVYDVEPNNEYEKSSLPERSRYYQALIDGRLLGSGEGYEILPDLYVIFILPYDPFGKGRMLYTIKSLCSEDATVAYKDGATKLFFYTDGAPEDCGSNVRDLLRYMKESERNNVTNETLGEIDEMVRHVKASKEVGVNYMKSWEIERKRMEEGREIGIEEGKEIGREEGREIGIEEGKKIGREEGKAEGMLILIHSVRANVTKGRKEEEIAEFWDMPLQKIQDIIEEIKKVPGGTDLEIAESILKREGSDK
jgi:predicted transposase/invertase (TIGR01784 family)